MRALVRHSRAAAPWGLVGVTAVCTVVLLLLVAYRPAVTWPLHGAAIGLVAGVSAWTVDEPCAAVVDVTARPLWWRTAARAPAGLLLLAVWTTTHVVIAARLPDRLPVFVLQGAGAAVGGFAAATWQRSRGSAEPGHALALVACPLAAAVALAKPGDGVLPLFPVWPSDDWARATAIWAVEAAVAAVVLGASLGRDAASRRGARVGGVTTVVRSTS